MTVYTDITKVQIGEVDLYYATVPANPTARDALVPAGGSTFAATAGWTRLGMLKEGLTLSQTTERYEVKGDADLGTVMITPLNMANNVKGELMEIAWDQLAVISGMGEAVVTAATPARKTKQIGPDTPTYVRKAIAWEGLDQAAFYERGMFWDCQLMIDGDRRRTRREEERIPFGIFPLQRGDLLAAGSGYGLFGFETKKTGA